MIEVCTDEQFNEVIQTGRVIVEFFTGWCPDCKMLDPYLAGWAETYAEQFQLVRADRDNFGDIAEKLVILGIPSFVAFDNGREVARLVSRDTKTKAEVEAFFAAAYQVRS